MPAYERLVGAWQIEPDEATGALTWLMGQLVKAIEGDEPPRLDPGLAQDDVDAAGRLEEEVRHPPVG
jgi:hypothetical protein